MQQREHGVTVTSICHDLWIHVRELKVVVLVSRGLTRDGGSMVVSGHGAVLPLTSHSMWLIWLHEVVMGLGGWNFL